MNPSGLLGGQAPRRVDEHDLVGFGEAEELPEDGQPTGSAAGQHRQERLDVVDVGQRPVVFPAFVMQVFGQVPDGRQGQVDGDVAARQRSGAAGAFARAQQELGEGLNGWPQRIGDRVDAAAAPSGRRPFGLIGGQGQSLAAEEGLQGAGERAHRSPRSAGPLQKRLGMVGALVVQEPT